MVIVLLLLAATLALSYAFPQIPAHVRSDPIAHREWFSATEVRYKGWTPALRAMGAFDVGHATWFLALIALVVLVSLVSLGHYIGMWIEQSRALQPAELFGAEDAVRFGLKRPADRVVDALRQGLTGLGLRVRVQHEEATTGIVAGRHRWADASVSLTYLGMLLIAVALALNGRWGWRRTDVQLRSGERAPIGPAGAHRISLVDVEAQGAWAEIQIDGGSPLRVGRERGARQWGYEVQLTGAGAPLVRVRASRVGAEPLALSEYAVRPASLEALDLAFSEAEATSEAGRLFIVPEDKLVVRLQWVNQSETAEGMPPRFRQWVFDQGGQDLIGEAEFEGAGGAAQTQIGEVTYTWDIATYAVLDIAYRPARWVLGAGALLIAIGLLGRAIPRQRVWARVASGSDGTTVLIRGTARGMARHTENTVQTLAEMVQEEMGNT